MIHTIKAYSIFLAKLVIPRFNYKSRKTNKEISKQDKYLHNVWLSREVSSSEDTGKNIVLQNVSRRTWNESR